jgi:hypothetical protein
MLRSALLKMTVAPCLAASSAIDLPISTKKGLFVAKSDTPIVTIDLVAESDSAFETPATATENNKPAIKAIRFMTCSFYAFSLL